MLRASRNLSLSLLAAQLLQAESEKCPLAHITTPPGSYWDSPEPPRGESATSPQCFKPRSEASTDSPSSELSPGQSHIRLPTTLVPEGDWGKTELCDQEVDHIAVPKTGDWSFPYPSVTALLLSPLRSTSSSSTSSPVMWPLTATLAQLFSSPPLQRRSCLRCRTPLRSGPPVIPRPTCASARSNGRVDLGMRRGRVDGITERSIGIRTAIASQTPAVRREPPFHILRSARYTNTPFGQQTSHSTEIAVSVGKDTTQILKGGTV